MSETTPEPDSIPPKKPSPWGRLYSLIWFGIAYWFFTTFSVNLVEREEQIATWDAYGARVISSEVRHISAEEGYEMNYRFVVPLESGNRVYDATMGHNSSKTLNTMAETDYAPGATLEVRINPENPSEFAFPGNKQRIRWVGYVGGAIFALIGLKVLLGGRNKTRSPTVGESDEGAAKETF